MGLERGGAGEYSAGISGGKLTRRTVFLPSSTEIVIYKRNGKLILDETDSLKKLNKSVPLHKRQLLLQ